jgi:hypothetical protein
MDEPGFDVCVGDSGGQVAALFMFGALFIWLLSRLVRAHRTYGDWRAVPFSWLSVRGTILTGMVVLIAILGLFLCHY